MKTVALTKGKVAVVDDCDFAHISQFRWRAKLRTGSAGDDWYAIRNLVREDGSRTTIKMHREILGAPPDSLVDHWDSDGLNNRRDNLRLCSLTQNNRNRRKQHSQSSSLFKGVTQVRGRWYAQIRVEAGKRQSLGYFGTEEDAARAYDAAAREHFGEFARLNFPEDGRNAA